MNDLLFCFLVEFFSAHFHKFCILKWTCICVVIGFPILRSQRGGPLLVVDNFLYRCERAINNRSYWLCIRYKSVKCNARIICDGNDIIKQTNHIHGTESDRIEKSKHLEYKNFANCDLKKWLDHGGNNK